MPEAAAMRAEEEASHLAAVEALAAVHPSPRTSGPKSDSVEAWAKRKRVEPWLFKAAKAAAANKPSRARAAKAETPAAAPAVAEPAVRAAAPAAPAPGRANLAGILAAWDGPEGGTDD